MREMDVFDWIYGKPNLAVIECGSTKSFNSYSIGEMFYVGNSFDTNMEKYQIYRRNKKLKRIYLKNK